MRTRIIKGLLVAGVIVGFGSSLHHLAHHRHARVDRLTRVCVDAALGREAPVGERHDRWVADRCAAHARDAPAP